MQLVARQTSDGSDGGTSSTLSTSDDPPSSSSSSNDSTSQPTSFPPSSSDPTLPPTSEPTTLPPSSVLTSSPPPSSSTIPPPISETTTSPTTSFIDPSVSPTVTEIITIIVTTVDSQATTLPTSLAASPPKASTTNRTAVLAGTSTAVVVFLLLVLAAVLAYRKHRLRKDIVTYGQKKEGRGLLDSEDFDEVLPHIMASYRDREVRIGASASVRRSTSPTPSLLKSRTSETGSVFREEVWPPPGFIDPISNRSNQVNLSRIVDEVMGPSDFNSPSTSRSGLRELGMRSHSSSSYSGLHERESTDATTMSGYSNFSLASANSSSPLLAPRNVPPSIPPISQYVDPSGGAPGISSVSNPSLPLGASPTTPGIPSPQIPPSSHYPMHSTSSRLSYSTSSHPGMSPSPEQNVSPQVRSKPTTQPKKSSPLARTLTADANTWLGRIAHRDDTSGPTTPTR